MLTGARGTKWNKTRAQHEGGFVTVISSRRHRVTFMWSARWSENRQEQKTVVTPSANFGVKRGFSDERLPTTFIRNPSGQNERLVGSRLRHAVTPARRHRVTLLWSAHRGEDCPKTALKSTLCLFLNRAFLTNVASLRPATFIRNPGEPNERPVGMRFCDAVSHSSS